MDIMKKNNTLPYIDKHLDIKVHQHHTYAPIYFWVSFSKNYTAAFYYRENQSKINDVYISMEKSNHAQF